MPLPSSQEFSLRINNEISVNQVNYRSWFWLADEGTIRNLNNAGWDISFFYNINDAEDAIPYLAYAMETWDLSVRDLMYMDVPAIHFNTAANSRIMFDFYISSINMLSWGSGAHLNEVSSGDLILPGTTISLPPGPSFTAVLVHGAYSSGTPVERGFMLLFIEVLGSDNARIPVHSFNPYDHQPNWWAYNSVRRANTLGLIPNHLNLSLRRDITRAEFAALATTLFETVLNNEILGRAQFNDTIDVNAQKMGFIGVITPDGYENFNPSNLIPRAEAAVFLTRLVSLMGLYLPESDETVFYDTSHMEDWIMATIRHMYKMGIMDTQEGYFFPYRPLNREDTIIIMLRIFDLF